MIKLLKLNISMITVLSAICSFYLSNFTVPQAYALDINKMAETEPEKEKEPEMAELNKEFFFSTAEKRFNELLEERGGKVAIIPYAHYDGGIFNTFAEYANTPYLPSDFLINEVLRNSYGVYPDYPEKYRSYYGEAFRGRSLEMFFSTLEMIVQYHAATNGYPYRDGHDPKALEKQIHENVIYLLKFLEEDSATTKAPASERDKNGIVNFISDYDNFVEKWYVAYANKTKVAKNKDATEKEEYERKLKAGKLPIKSKSDAILYYNAEDGSSIVMNPPLKGDNKYYVVSGKLERVEGNQYIVYFDTAYFAFEMTAKGKSYNPDFRIEKWLNVVGKFVGTLSYTTVAGTTKYAAAFKADFVEMQ